MSEEKLSFQAEVSKLLDIVAHSLYSNSEIFLRELISNASDACDKLRYAALTAPDLTKDDSEFRISITLDKVQKTLTISDNGIGMSRQELIDNLGTIARSGTEAFVKTLEGQSRKDVSQIGQFGVGFYSAFMVAERVDVVSLRAGETQAWRWTSDGKGEFSVVEAERGQRGTTITLSILEAKDEYLEASRIRQIVKTYSDHIAIPVQLTVVDEAKKDDDSAIKDETLNSASAIWMRGKSDIDADQYKEFYHHVSHNFDDPWLTMHNHVEGVIEYNNLLFIPTKRPFDLFQAERKNRLKLYVKRVFISDDCEELLPAYLRFINGVVDSQDLPLNVSREMLQHNPVLAKIRSGLVKRVLGELKKKAENEPEDYLKFWETFGAVFKEGIYEDFTNRDDCVHLARFRSTKDDGWVSLAEYVARMKEGQETIFYISGDDIASLKQSPQLEGFKAKGIEVLLLNDPIDEFWIPSYGDFDGKSFKSVTQGGAELGDIKGDDASEPEQDEKSEAVKDEMDRLCAAFKVALGDTVKDVRTTERLRESAVCLVADEHAMDRHLQRMLKQHGQNVPSDAPILEINPKHGLIKRLAELSKDGANATLSDAAFLLVDQAKIVEGESVVDPIAFAKRLASMMEKGLVG